MEMIGHKLINQKGKNLQLASLISSAELSVIHGKHILMLSLLISFNYQLLTADKFDLKQL